MNNKDEIYVEINKTQKNSKSKKKKSKKTRNNIKKMKQASKKKKMMKVLLLIILVIAILIILASSEIFNIKEISVSGMDNLSKNEIISFSKIEIGDNTFKINIKKVKNLIRENPYVKDVSIKRVLPGKIEICIEERKVKYMIQLAESYIFVDGQGYILEISKAQAPVPILLGILTDLSNIEIGSRLKKQDLEKFNTLNEITEVAKNYKILPSITKIDITNKLDFILYFDEENKMAYIGDGTNLNTRILWIKKILEDEKDNKGKIYVNMDLNTKRPYFRSE